MTGRNVYSIEAAPVIQLPWAQTWTGSHRIGYNVGEEYYWADDGSNYVYRPTASNNQDAGMLYHLNRSLAAGVNRVVMHGFSNIMGNWPHTSYMSMGNFPNEWDESTPMWEHINQMTDYLSRSQFVMQKGQADVDLAVYRNYYYEFANPAHDWALNDMEKAGFTYDFASPELLALDNAVVSNKDGRMVLAENGPAYKALVLDQRKFTGTGGGLTASSMPIPTAEKILSYAKAGLPVLIVGDAPSSVGTFGGSLAALTGENEQLKAIMAELAALPTTKTVASKSDVVPTLKSLGVEPDVKKDAPSALLNFHRADIEGEYYYLYNSDLNRSITQTVDLLGEGIPYLLDPWSGEITPIAEYIRKDGRISLEINLKPNENMFIAIAEDNLLDIPFSNLYIVETNADEVAYGENKSFAVKTTAGGAYYFEFSNGYSAELTIPVAEQPIALKDWSMMLVSWEVGGVDGIKNPMGPYQLSELVPWNEIPEIGLKAGVATYTTSFYLEKGRDKGQGAVIDFERVTDTMKLRVNGAPVPVNQFSNKADIGKYLVSGENTISVDVTSNVTNIQSGNTGRREEFGIIGDVTLTPYVLTEIPDTVFADIHSDEEAVSINSPASYTISLINAKGAGVVTLSFNADSRYLDLKNATALNGFSILDPLTWEYVGSQMWKGTVKLFCPGFVNTNDPLAVLKINGVTCDLIGDTTVTLTDISVTGDLNGSSGVLPSAILTAEAATSVVPKAPVYSKYDLNHDGKIDELDLTIVVYYYLANDLEADWDVVKFDIASAKDCDVARNGRVDLADMIEVIANYCESYVLQP
ncbi:MAG: hypothetical protein FWH55_02585 [Oscillospiraceae bacterium]|nr:hypothetical protein [Oscillospiraceae bacterium]